jgi:hypothetical protein
MLSNQRSQHFLSESCWVHLGPLGELALAPHMIMLTITIYSIETLPNLTTVRQEVCSLSDALWADKAELALVKAGQVPSASEGGRVVQPNAPSTMRRLEAVRPTGRIHEITIPETQLHELETI